MRVEKMTAGARQANSPAADFNCGWSVVNLLIGLSLRDANDTSRQPVKTRGKAQLVARRAPRDESEFIHASAA